MDKNAIKVMPTFNNITYALYRIASAIFDDSCMAETRIRYEECPEKNAGEANTSTGKTEPDYAA